MTQDTRDRLARIEARYGEDVADAVAYAIALFNDPDIEDGGEDPGSDWSLYHFFLATGSTPDEARFYIYNIEARSRG